MRTSFYFSRSIEVLSLSTLTVLLPLSPLACTALSGSGRYLRSYRSSVQLSARCLAALNRTRVISRNLQRSLRGAVAPSETIKGSCTHCGLCCVDKSCVFLAWSEDGASRCSIYNNWFWKMTSCGSYPVDHESIEVYGCPSFKAIPIKVVSQPHSLRSSSKPLSPSR